MRLSHAIPGFEAGSRPHSKNLPFGTRPQIRTETVLFLRQTPPASWASRAKLNCQRTLAEGARLERANPEGRLVSNQLGYRYPNLPQNGNGPN